MGAKSDCYRCVHRRAVSGSCHSKCDADFSKIEPPAGDKHGIKNGWWIFPWNYDPIWMEGKCENFKLK